MKIVMALSGGLDSAVLLAKALAFGHTVTCAQVQYGSKHNKLEGEAADRVARYYGVPILSLDLRGAFVWSQSNLLRTGNAVPEGHYEEESMRATVVPGRNLVIVAALAGVAESLTADEVWLGVHAGDHFIYPDCRPAFVHAANQTVVHSTEGRVTVAAPFLHFDKARIVAMGAGLGAPFGVTRTCYTDAEIACGRCGSCVERREAFAVNGLTDPVLYSTVYELPPSPRVMKEMA